MALLTNVDPMITDPNFDADEDFYERLKRLEDPAAAIPWLTELDTVNKTILRCSDNILRIKFAGMASDNKVIALKLQKATNQAML